VPCVPKLSKNIHDAITVDYSKEFRSKCWQGNETGIAVLVSGEVKPEGWTGPVEREKGENQQLGQTQSLDIDVSWSHPITVLTQTGYIIASDNICPH